MTDNPKSASDSGSAGPVADDARPSTKSDQTQIKGPGPRLVQHGSASNADRPAHVAAKDESTVSRPKTAGDFAQIASEPKSEFNSEPRREDTSVIAAVENDEATPRVEVSSAGVRQARLKVVRIEPWSAAKVTFALSVALGIVAIVAVTILWVVLSFAGVWDQINSSVTTVLSDNSGTFDITDYLGLGRLVGFTIMLSALNTIVMTAIAVIGSHLYNLAVQLLGGVDIMLSEDN